MRLSILREDLLQPLQCVIGVVEKRQTLPILSHVLMCVEHNRLTFTGTDLEVQLLGHISLTHEATPGSLTVPGRKLLDICRSLPAQSLIEIYDEKQKVILKTGRSKFSLNPLAAKDFPAMEEDAPQLEFNIEEQNLREIIDHIQFAMAHQDVRYYLNGLLLDVSGDKMHAVATDGHRLAMAEHKVDGSADAAANLIVPRKGVTELARLLGHEEDTTVSLTFSQHFISLSSKDWTFTSKLIDGRFPDYRGVVPKGGDKQLICNNHELVQALSRAAILTNEKYKGVRFDIASNSLKITANNPEQEQAEEEVSVQYEGEDFTIGFNVAYLLDALNTIDEETVSFTFSSTNNGVLLEPVGNEKYTYVVMPMRL